MQDQMLPEGAVDDEALSFQQRVEKASMDLPDIFEAISSSQVELYEDAAALIAAWPFGPYLAYFIAKKAAHDSDISSAEPLSVADVCALEIELRQSVFRAVRGMDVYAFDFKSSASKIAGHVVTTLSGIRLH